MKIWGRHPRRYVANLVRVPQNARDLIRCIKLFRAPGEFVRAYVTRTPPRSGAVRLRSGMRILLSDDPLDIVTVFGLFVRKDYGVVPSGSRVLDIGANIGVFTLYAIHCGAAVVHSYEPSGESFTCLTRNIEENGLADRVDAFRTALGAGPERLVRFPRQSSVLNTIPAAGAGNDEACDDVPLEPLPTAIARLPAADFIKIDCEGEEERILAAADASTLAGISAVRLEYHLGRGAAVAELMTERGFTVAHWWAPDSKGGIIWFVRA